MEINDMTVGCGPFPGYPNPGAYLWHGCICGDNHMIFKTVNGATMYYGGYTGSDGNRMWWRRIKDVTSIIGGSGTNWVIPGGAFLEVSLWSSYGYCGSLQGYCRMTMAIEKLAVTCKQEAEQWLASGQPYVVG